jgi:type IV secretion system protein VirB4
MNLAEYRRTATRLADFLPWAALVAEGVVLNKDGSFQRTAFRGPDLDPPSQPNWSPSPGGSTTPSAVGSGWAIFVEAQRHEASIYPRPVSRRRRGAGRCRAQGRFRGGRRAFRVRLYLTFTYLPPAEDAARAEAWLYEGRERPASIRGKS